MYADGSTLRVVGDRFGVTAVTVAKVVRRHGVPIREAGNAGKGDLMRTARQIRQEHGAAMAEMYADGATLQEVGDRYSVAHSVVRQAVRVRGGHIRKRGWGSVPDRYTMENNPGWKGGRHTRHGYSHILLPPDSPWLSMAPSGGSGRRRYVLEHRLVMAQMINRPLDHDETVHHIDGDRGNNAPSNLQLRRGQHGKGVHLSCGDCGSRNVGAIRI